MLPTNPRPSSVHAACTGRTGTLRSTSVLRGMFHRSSSWLMLKRPSGGRISPKRTEKGVPNLYWPHICSMRDLAAVAAFKILRKRRPIPGAFHRFLDFDVGKALEFDLGIGLQAIVRRDVGREHEATKIKSRRLRLVERVGLVAHGAVSADGHLVVHFDGTWSDAGSLWVGTGFGFLVVRFRIWLLTIRIRLHSGVVHFTSVG